MFNINKRDIQLSFLNEENHCNMKVYGEALLLLHSKSPKEIERILSEYFNENVLLVNYITFHMVPYMSGITMNFNFIRI